MLPIFEDELIVIENGVLRECKDNDLMTISIPDGTIAIADNVFRNCTNLIEISLPQTLTKIGSHAFEGCSSLTAIDLSNVNIIGEYAFSGCSSLNKVTFSDNIGYHMPLAAVFRYRKLPLVIKSAIYATVFFSAVQA